MGSFYRTAGGVAAALLAGATLVTAPTSAEAKAAVRVIRIGCSSAALTTAITTSNANATVPYIIRLAPFCNYAYATGFGTPATTTALPVITGRIALIGGPSTFISATGAGFRLVNIGSGGRARIQGITIRKGVLPLDAAATGENGGGILVQSGGFLLLVRDTISGNSTTASPTTAATPSGGNGGGLAVESGGTASVSLTLVSGNTAAAATGTGTTAGGLGGAIYNAGTLRLFGSRLTANSATSPAAVATATGSGGGLATDTTGNSRVVQSTFDRNVAANNGDGIFTNTVGAVSGSTTIIRTLIVRNRANGTTVGAGGGVFGPRTIIFSIIRNNSPDNCASPATPCGIA